MASHILWFQQSFSNADLVDEEAVAAERSCCAPQWRCYAKYVNSQQIFLTFLPASFSGAPQNASFLTLRRPQSANVNLAVLFKSADVLTLMASGAEAEPQSLLSPQAQMVEQDGWEHRTSETETATSGSGWFNADVQISPAKNSV